MRPDGQYTLDCDPMVLAKRVQQLEHAVDTLSGSVCDLTHALRNVACQCELGLSEGHPLQASSLSEEHDRLSHVYDRAHAASVMMGRSY